MKGRGLWERCLGFVNHLGDGTRLRRQMRIVLLIGTAVFVLWSSPTTAQPSATFSITAAPHSTVAIEGDAENIGQTGVVGHASATSGQNFGVVGITDSAGDSTTQSRAFGVVGHATASSGFTAGVLGRVDGIGDLTTQTPAVGVLGRATATATGFTIGVRGVSDGPGDTFLGLPSIGVDGRADSPSGFTIGVRGRIADINGNPGGSPTGTGVLGVVTPPSCPTLNLTPSTPVFPGQTCVGVFGRSLATSGSTAGVVGLTQSSSPSAGVVGETTGIGASSSNAVAGVVGQATATSGFNAGVFGQTNSPNGAAIFGSATGGGLAGSFQGGPVSINCPIVFPASCLVVNQMGVMVPDLAEDMPVARPVSPGDVVVLTRGQGYGIAPAARAYDTLVAGIVSTAPRVRFGIGKVKAAPVAMVGVVKAKASAVNGAIEFGDLLTTSPVAGHLMRCDAALKCVGAIVGKALEPLPKGEQSILVLLWRQ